MKRILGILLLMSIPFGLLAQAPDAKEKMRQLIRENFMLADSQYHVMMKLTPGDSMPQTYDGNARKLISKRITWWCSGFYPGALWLVYEQTKDEKIKAEAERALQVIESNQSYTGNHDLGFMMYCSFGNAFRITRVEKYKQIIFRSSESLATRYRPSIKSIQSWNANEVFRCPVIIDNMMNLEMLNWTSDNGGGQKFREIAVNHANTTLKNHFRADFSSYHVVDYNLETGKVNRKTTWQGAADCSAWARGQGWALYGFTMMYRFTKKVDYLNQARQIARFIIHHPKLPADKVPYWDFDAPQVPGIKRDASAAAIMASALLELGQYTIGAEKKEFVSVAETMLQSLSGDNYRSKPGEHGGFLLMHSTGHLPANSEVDVPLIYADYYFLEALKRYKDWYL